MTVDVARFSKHRPLSQLSSSCKWIDINTNIISNDTNLNLLCYSTVFDIFETFSLKQSNDMEVWLVKVMSGFQPVLQVQP